MITDKRQSSFTNDEIYQHNKETRNMVVEHVNNMSIDELKTLAMGTYAVCPICRKIKNHELINIGLEGQCINSGIKGECSND